MHDTRFHVRAFLLFIWAVAVTADAQTPTAVSLSFSGGGVGSYQSFTLNGSGSISPFGAATIVIMGSAGAAPSAALTITLKRWRHALRVGRGHNQCGYSYEHCDRQWRDGRICRVERNDHVYDFGVLYYERHGSVHAGRLRDRHG
jgi:hypothetical protein